MRFKVGSAALAALAVLALGALNGCKGSGEASVIRVATFGDADLQAFMRDRLKALEQQEGIRAEPMFIPYNNYHEKLLTQLAAGNAPEVAWIEVNLYVPMQAAGAFLPLDEYLAKDKIDLKGHYAPLVNRFTTEGKLFALPQDTAPIANVYYNKKMLKAVGLKAPKDDWRWADLLAMAKKLTKRGADGKVEVFGYEDNGGPDWPSFLYANGGRIVDDWKKPTRCVLDEPAAVEAVQFLSDMINVHGVTQRAADRGTLTVVSPELFGLGKLAMFHSGLWVVPALRKVKDLEWDMVAFPRGPRAKEPGWNTGGSGWTLLRGGKQAEKAWRVVRFLASEETQRYNLKTGYAQPSIIKIAESDTFLKDNPPDNKKFLVTAPQYAHYMPEMARWPEAAAMIDRELNGVWRGVEKAEPALKRIAATMNRDFFTAKK